VTTSPCVKICCIASVEEALLAIRLGASAIGLVSAMPSGPGPIAEELIRQIAGSIPSHIHSFLLTSHTDPSLIIEQHRRCSTTAIQLCDRQDIDSYKVLREHLPATTLVQVIHVSGASSCEEAKEISPHVDFLLLDSGRPDLPVKELGGTGRVHDWSVSRKICEAVKIPVYLAGGLDASNVRAAIDYVRPFGVDVCSGVRTGGTLEERKLSLFFGAVNGAGTTG
jgi:phosphoribosylanthranilate isomerase